MLYIQHRGRPLQIIELTQRNRAIVFGAKDAHTPDSNIYSGNIITDSQRKVISVEVQGQSSELFFDRWVFPKGGEARYNNFVQIAGLGMVDVELGGQHITSQQVQSVLYAHKHSEYLKDPSKMLYMAGSLAPVTLIVLEDNSRLLRGWVFNDELKQTPIWFYDRPGQSFARVLVTYTGIL